jgi:hypothetical protein
LENVPLNLDHVRPRSAGGSNRVSNLVPACVECNQRKDDQDVRVFLKHDVTRLHRIVAELKAPLKDAAAVNSTRWALHRALKQLGLPVATGTGGRTKWNRHLFGVPKTHALDAVCVGNMDSVTAVIGWEQPTLLITATGRGAYQRTRLTSDGFPRGYLMHSKSVHGFATGDMVKAVVPKGNKQGTYLARVAVRASGSFDLQTATRVLQGISHKHCRVIQRGNGYSYALLATLQKESGKTGHASRYPSPA